MTGHHPFYHLLNDTFLQRVINGEPKISNKENFDTDLIAITERMISKHCIARPSISEMKNSKAISKLWTIQEIIDGWIDSPLKFK